MITDAQYQRLEQLDLVETAEVMDLAVSLFKDTISARADDGKVSLMESAFIAVKNITSAKAATRDIANVGAELANIDAEKTEALADIFFPQIEFGPAEFCRQMVDRLIAWFIATAHVYQGIRDKENWVTPPKAVVVEEGGQ